MSPLMRGLESRTDVAVSDKMLNVLVHIESPIGVTDKFIDF